MITRSGRRWKKAAHLPQHDPALRNGPPYHLNGFASGGAALLERLAHEHRSGNPPPGRRRNAERATERSCRRSSLMLNDPTLGVRKTRSTRLVALNGTDISVKTGEPLLSRSAKDPPLAAWYDAQRQTTAVVDVSCFKAIVCVPVNRVLGSLTIARRPLNSTGSWPSTDGSVRFAAGLCRTPLPPKRGQASAFAAVFGNINQVAVLFPLARVCRFGAPRPHYGRLMSIDEKQPLASSENVVPQDVAASMGVEHLAINTIRTLSMDAVQAANSGHPGTPMALAPVAYTIWQNFWRFDPADPTWPNRDRFVLSCGHASMCSTACCTWRK